MLKGTLALPSGAVARHQSVMGPCACSTSGSTTSSTGRRRSHVGCPTTSSRGAAQSQPKQHPAQASGRLVVTSAASRAATPPLSQSDPSQQPDRILQALQQQEQQEQQQRQERRRQQRQQDPGSTPTEAQPAADLGPWTYKYQRLRCSSPCARSDRRCHEVEALFQHVLSYERLPPKVARWLCTIDANLDAMTDLVENMAQHFGKELTLWFLRKNPAILGCDFATVLARCTAAQELVGLRPAELPMLLRKNPMLMSMDSELTRSRYEAIPRCVDFRPEQVRQLVTKCPLVLNYHTPALRGMVESLRQLAYTRDEWQADFEALSPSLLAYYIRDHSDLLRRLEYLVATGEATACSLRDVFKPSNNLFAGRYRGFRKWADLMKRRRGELGGR